MVWIVSNPMAELQKPGDLRQGINIIKWRIPDAIRAGVAYGCNSESMA